MTASRSCHAIVAPTNHNKSQLSVLSQTLWSAALSLAPCDRGLSFWLTSIGSFFDFDFGFLSIGNLKRHREHFEPGNPLGDRPGACVWLTRGMIAGQPRGARIPNWSSANDQLIVGCGKTVNGSSKKDRFMNSRRREPYVNSRKSGRAASRANH